MADVIASMWLMLLPLFVLYLADLIANVADVIATFFFLLCVCVLADVIAMVVDVKTTQGNWYMADVIAICG